MINRNSKHLKYIASVVLFFFFFTLFFYIYFPSDSLKKRISLEIKDRFGLSVDIGTVDISPLANIKIGDLRLTDEGKGTEKPLLIDEIKISPSLSSLFSKGKKASFIAKIEEGSLEGTVDYSGGKKLDFLEAKLDRVDIKVMESLLKNVEDVPGFGGKVSGEVNVLTDRKGSVKGDFRLRSDDLSLSGLKIRNFSLPDYKSLRSDIKGRINRGRTWIDNLRIESEDFDLVLAGTAPLPWKIKKGTLDLSVNLELKTGSKMKFLKAFMKEEEDGTISAKIKGPFRKIRFEKN